MLEDAQALLWRLGKPARPQAAPVDDDDFAGLHGPDILGAHDVEGAGLGRHQPGIAVSAEIQRPEALRVSGSDEHVPGEEHEAVGAHELLQGIHDRFRHVGLPGACDEVQHDLAVGGGLEDGPGVLHLPPELGGIGDGPVVSHRYGAGPALYDNGLGIDQGGASPGGVAVVADGRVSLEPGHDGRVGKDRPHEPHAPVVLHAGAVRGGDAGALLPPVLEGVEPEVCLLCGPGVAVDAHNAAFLAPMVVKMIIHAQVLCKPGASPVSELRPRGAAGFHDAWPMVRPGRGTFSSIHALLAQYCFNEHLHYL